MRRSSRGTQLEEHPAATATQQRRRHLTMQAARSRSTPGATVARPSFREHVDYLAQATQRPASRLGHQYPRNKYRECWPKSLCQQTRPTKIHATTSTLPNFDMGSRSISINGERNEIPKERTAVAHQHQLYGIAMVLHGNSAALACRTFLRRARSHAKWQVRATLLRSQSESAHCNTSPTP